MFKDNKYTKIYYQIIEKSKNPRNLEFKEIHHIIPKSLGGSNEPDNLAILTPREHFICHRLLPKMLQENTHISKMIFALWVMVNGSGRRPRYIPSSRTYEQISKENSNYKSKKMIGTGNHFYGKKHSIETRKRMSENNPAKRPEVREKMRGPRKHFLPHNHFNGWDETTKKKISASLKGFKHSDETRENMKKAKENLRWVHRTGEKPIQIKEYDLDSFLTDGWVRGRGPREYW